MPDQIDIFNLDLLDQGAGTKPAPVKKDCLISDMPEVLTTCKYCGQKIISFTADCNGEPIKPRLTCGGWCAEAYRKGKIIDKGLKAELMRKYDLKRVSKKRIEQFKRIKEG